MLQSPYYEFAIQAAAACKDKKVADEVFEYIQEAYENCANKEKDTEERTANLNIFVELIEALWDRTDERVFDLYAKAYANRKSIVIGDHTMTKMLFQYFRGSSRIYSPQKHYDTFVGMYKSKECPLTSITISSVYFNSKEPVNFDKRWLKAFIEKEDMDLVCEMVKAGDQDAVNGLVKFLEKGIKRKKLSSEEFYTWDADLCVKTLMDIGYKGLDKLIFDILKECNWDSEYDEILEMVKKNTGRIFPKDTAVEYIKKFNALSKERSIDIYAELADKLKTIYGEE